MIKLGPKYTYAITRNGGLEEWLTTVKAVLFLLSNQNNESPPDPHDVQQICHLIDDMLPDEQQIMELEQCLHKCHKVTAE